MIRKLRFRDFEVFQGVERRELFFSIFAHRAGYGNSAREGALWSGGWQRRARFSNNARNVSIAGIFGKSKYLFHARQPLWPRMFRPYVGQRAALSRDDG